MTDVSNFGMRSARNGSPVGPAPVTGAGLPRWWSPTVSPALTRGRQHTTTSVREADITDVAGMLLPEELLPIVKGLSLGKPDVTVSRLLDMSPRTFSRKVAELLAYLEVETRFQAGAEVTHRWMLCVKPR
jgi:DNA-binding NarL/FixJ family response regulator